MKVIVNDANILIDIAEAGLLTPFFELPFEMHASDLVMNELEEPAFGRITRFVGSGRLTNRHFTASEHDEIGKLYDQYAGLALEDCSCLYMALQYSAVLLTGDRLLRNTARAYGITVHGVLWVLEMMVRSDLLSTRLAIEKLQYLMDINVRLPKAACENLIKKWRSVPS